MVSEIQADIEAIQRNATLWEEVNFGSRMEALDYLEFYIIDRIDSLRQLNNPPAELLVLKQQAETIKSQLEDIDATLFARLRATVQSGHCRGATLLNLIDRYVGHDLSSQLVYPAIGYDSLDVFTNGLFPLYDLPLAIQEREPEMVFYQKTPARIILELVAKANLTDHDVFYDLGAGLGHVCVLVNLLSGATAKGIEIEPAYWQYASACATDFNLSNVSFICEDARTADYSDGTVFFLFTPFEGGILQAVLAKLETISRYRQIRIFTYGPCTDSIARQSWLTSRSQVSQSLYQLSEFSSCPLD